MRKFFYLLGAVALVAMVAYAADQRIQYSERMIGANHPTLTDTLNRLTLVAHNTDGTHIDNGIALAKLTHTGTPDNTTVYRGDGKWDNGVEGGWEARGGMVKQQTTWHSTCGFDNAGVVIDATQNIWFAVTNVTNDLWTAGDTVGFTHSQDNLVVLNAADYMGILSITFSGGNGVDWGLRLYNITQATVEGFPIRTTTSGAANYATLTLPLYADVLANDKLQIQMVNYSDSTDPTIVSGVCRIVYLHN